MLVRKLKVGCSGAVLDTAKGGNRWNQQQTQTNSNGGGLAGKNNLLNTKQLSRVGWTGAIYLWRLALTANSPSSAEHLQIGRAHV